MDMSEFLDRAPEEKVPEAEERAEAVKYGEAAGDCSRPTGRARPPFADILRGVLPSPAGAPETEDILLLLILLLLYRESGDTELLMILGAMLFL